MKNQGSYVVCWAFGAYGSLESSVYKYTGLKENYAEESLRLLYSVDMKDKLNVANTYNMGAYMRSSDGGGNSLISLAYLTNRNNPISNGIKWVSPNNTSDIAYGTITNINDDVLHLFNSSYGSNYVSDACYINFDINNVKKAIMEHGGVTTDFSANGLYINPNNGATNNRVIDLNSAHSIELVGWDDNYSQSNFKSNCTPNNKGAFLYKNSWGNNWGDNGYGWVSYEDVSLNMYNCTFVVESVDKLSKNEQMLSYDYLPPTGDNNIQLGENENSICMANVYDVSELINDYIDMRNLFNKLCGNVTVAGDVDNSGTFDISDITYIQKYLAGAIQLTTAQRFAAGINLTGNINTVTNYQKNLADIKSADGTGIEYTGSKITYFKNNYSAIGYDIEYYSPVTESTNYIYYADRYKDNSAI